MTLPEIIKAEQEKARKELYPILGHTNITDSLIASSMLAAVKGAEEAVVPPDNVVDDESENNGAGSMQRWMQDAFRSFIGETK